MSIKRLLIIGAVALLVALVVTLNQRSTNSYASTDDQVQLMSLTNQHIFGVYAYPTLPIVRKLAYSNGWALVSWTDLKYAGGQFIAQLNSSGKWVIVRNGGGVFNANELTNYGVPSSVAAYLVSNLQPPLPTPTPSPSGSGRGSSYSSDVTALIQLTISFVTNGNPAVLIPWS